MDNQIPKPGESQKRPQLPALPWKTRATIFLLTAVTDAASRDDGTVNRRLFSIVNSLGGLKAPPDPKPRDGVATADVAVDPSRDLWFRLFTPSPHSSSPLPVVVFFHGGGFVYLAPDYKVYDDVCRRFAREIQAVVVSVNYRLAPEHRYPAQYEDAFDVLRFLDDRRDVLPGNADVSRCFVAGDSAGGNMAHHVSKRAAASPFSHLKVIGVVAIQPFFGGEGRVKSETDLAGVDPIVSVKRIEWMWRAFIPLDGGMDRDHPAINVSGPNADEISGAANFPATMVVVGGFDSLKDWQIGFYEWLVKSGKEAYLVEYPNMIHAFYIFPELPESGQLIAEMKKFIDKQCSGVFPAN